MINTAAKLTFALAVVAFVSAVGYGTAVGDRVGTLLFFTLGAVCVLLALAEAGSGASDRAPRFDPDTPPATVPVGSSAATRPSPWPIAAALAVGIGAVGLAVGAVVIYVGLALLALTAIGWLGQAWREHPSWTRSEDVRLVDRVVAPFAVPLGALVLVLIIVISVSRVLLAVNEKASVAVAGVCAVGVLMGFAFIASRPRTGSRILAVLAGITLVAVAGAGVAGATKGERDFEKSEPAEPTFKVVAKSTQFNVPQLQVPGGKKFAVQFTNKDSGIYHDVAVYTEEGKPVVAGQPIAGVKKTKYEWNIPPGKYTFRCDFHANMTGTLIAQ